MEHQTACDAAEQVHANSESAIKVHLSQELGLSVDDQPSPMVAAVSSFMSFSVGALIPLILLFLFGFGNLWLALASGGAGLIIAGSLAAFTTGRNWFAGGLRQLTSGGIAVIATFTIGKLLGVETPM